MPSLPVITHPHCLRCGSLVPAMSDPAVQYDGHVYHFSCAVRTILEKSVTPHEPPHQDLKNIHPRF